MARSAANIPTISVGRPPGPVLYKFPTRPLPKERPRIIQRGKKTFAKSTDKTKAYEDSIAEYAALQHPRNEGPWEGELTVFITLYFSGRNHGDIDNCVKAILDAVQARKDKNHKWHPGIVCKNDKQIRALHVETKYRKGQPERSELVVMPYVDSDEILDAESGVAGSSDFDAGLLDRVADLVD